MTLALRLSTAVDHVDEIAIATLYLLVMMILAVWIRLIFRYYILRSLQWDDAMVSVALALAIAQSAIIFSGTQNGFGKLQSEMSAANFITVEKVATPFPLSTRSTNIGGRQDLYSSDLLYILSLSLAKISVIQFLNKLCVAEIHKIICRWSSLLVAVWTIPVVFTLAFKCGASSPWDLENGHCIKIFDFWAAISPIDIITELVICLLPIYIVKPVQMRIGKKLTVVTAFIFRILVIITTIARLIFMSRADSLADMNTAAFATSITTQLTLCLSVMTACIPCLKPFLDAFDSGMLNVSLHERVDGSYSNSYSHSNAYALVSMTRGTKESRTRSQYLEDEVEGLGTSASAFAVTAPVRPAIAVGSAMCIQRTDQWSVRREHVDRKEAESLGDETEASEDRGSRRGNPSL
ncbi:uncharacterized protein BHQ10_009238 [Talaromyces amestolkiae]|uniref:Rhodopsin domain-containing protein n=1 Tax=Talaromyces amestolkiae TaxID=1196081 RepID=A0A364LBN0_TALAM|nr:uncharacterized protein BHQ10_009238 [Talaromyces amestolkiae]RAO73226.1 hypothetical protein BHQ10_009238 [Talaromyces amestolkiae]